ncbi:MAG: S8 family serine peptidase [Deltaproteobacteria bacterium]|nr:S8 family serine peptidase [Deltaproteobacteria bacterium]
MAKKSLPLIVMMTLGLILLGAVDGLQAKTKAKVNTGWQPAKASVKFAPGEVLVKFKQVSPRKTVGPASDASFLAMLPEQAHQALHQIQGTVEEVYPFIACLKVKIPQTMAVGEAIESLYRSGAVDYAEPNYEVYADQVQIRPFPDKQFINKTPNDPRFNDLWGMHNTGQTGGTTDADIDAPEAWNKKTWAGNVIVGVIDTGVDYNHEDLKVNMWKNPKEIPANGKDDDGNGYIDDVYGIDTYNNDADPMDDHYHGTHCAGTIGAVGNNQTGVVGVCWRVKIMALKFLSSGGSGYTDDAIECINYALAMKTREKYARMVLSNSWGGGGYSTALFDAIKAARNKGVLFVAASGNSNRDTDVYPHYPSSYNSVLHNIIAVNASDHNDKKASFSNYGCYSTDLFAPGVDIWSTFPMRYSTPYGKLSGTSMATPHVAGACALVWARRPTLNYKKIKGLILNGAESGKGADFGQRCLTEGRLNVNRSMQSGKVNDPAIFQVTPNKACIGDKITIVGISFGATKGTLKFKGTAFPGSAIVSWTNTKIVAKMPSGLPKGFGRLQVTTSGGTSRGACFGNINIGKIAGHTILGHGWSCSAQVGQNVWIISGGTYWGQTGLVERYNLKTKRAVIDSGWMIPTTVTNAGAAAIGNKIYVLGGLDWDTGEVYKKLQVFDTTTGKWTSRRNFPFEVMQPAMASYNGKLYVFGGQDKNGAVIKTTYVYNPATNTWAKKADLPNKAAYAAGVRLGKNLWVLGGFTSKYFGSEQNLVQVYNADTNTWSSKANMNNERGGAAGILSGKVCCLHGAGDGSYGRNDGEYIAAGKWTTEFYGQQGLYTPLAGKYLGKIYVLGGYDWQVWDFSNNVWSYRKP